MKAVLTYNLPEDQAEYNLHMAAPKLAAALYELREELRRLIKYESAETEEFPGLERAQEILVSCLESAGVNLDEVYQ